MNSSSRTIERVAVTFDDPTLVADAGLLVPATLMVRLGLEVLVNQMVRLGGRVGGARPGRKVLTLVAAILAGATHIDHVDRLRAGATHKVLPFRVMAPSTLGTFLRAFTFGHIRQLDKVIAETIRRAWALGAGPGADRMVIDLDSTICEVHGKLKQGAAYGYTHVLGYHPLVAVWSKTGEILHARLRKGSSQRGHKRFVEELVARVRRAGAAGPLVVRADAGFWSWALIDTLRRAGVAWSITVTINAQIRACIEAIDESAWVPIAYPDGGEAQVAEASYLTRVRGEERTVRLVVRRTRLTGRAQRALWPDWRHHAFVTDLDLPLVDDGPIPPRARHGRTGHPRPEGGSGPRALSLGAVLRQRGMARLRGAGPQPHPLELPVWATSIPTISSPWRARCGPGCSPFPDASSIEAGPSSCVSPSAGPGPPRSPALSIRSVPCRSSPEARYRGPAQPQTLTMR